MNSRTDVDPAPVERLVGRPSCDRRSFFLAVLSCLVSSTPRGPSVGTAWQIIPERLLRPSASDPQKRWPEVPGGPGWRMYTGPDGDRPLIPANGEIHIDRSNGKVRYRIVDLRPRE